MVCSFIVPRDDKRTHHNVYLDYEVGCAYAILSTMSKVSLSIYRLPTPRAARIGAVRVVMDRNQQVYVAGSRVEATAPSGEFLILTLANNQAYYVKADEYAQARAGSVRKPKK